MKKIALLLTCTFFVTCFSDNQTAVLQVGGMTVSIAPSISKEFCTRSGGLLGIAAGLSLFTTGFKRATKCVQATDPATNQIIKTYPNAKSGSLLAAIGAALTASGIWAITR